MLVEVSPATIGSYSPQFVETGTVTAAHEIDLATQASGLVLSVHESFVPGGFVQQDDVVIEIESADYENTLRQRRSELMRARAELRL